MVEEIKSNTHPEIQFYKPEIVQTKENELYKKFSTYYNIVTRTTNNEYSLGEFPSDSHVMIWLYNPLKQGERTMKQLFMELASLIKEEMQKHRRITHPVPEGNTPYWTIDKIKVQKAFFEEGRDTLTRKGTKDYKLLDKIKNNFQFTIEIVIKEELRNPPEAVKKEYEAKQKQLKLQKEMKKQSEHSQHKEGTAVQQRCCIMF
eukprot:403368801